MAGNKHIIKHHKLDPFIRSIKIEDIPKVVLIYGESYLVKQSFHTLSSFLLGKDMTELAVEILEGGSVSMGDIIEQISTFSFLVPKKIVVVRNIPLFQTQQGNQDICFSVSDLDHLTHCIEKGVPDNHFLVFTTSSTDKRKKIFKTIQDNGLIIDCAVSSGSRKADIDEQRSVFRSVADRLLQKSQKDIDAQAFHALVDLTGFNLDLFYQNLKKLIAYSGRKASISLGDVTAVIKRDKKDPIFNLTNALMEKDVEKSIFYTHSLLNEGFHPLQILKSLENQIRKLMLVKSCVQIISQNTPMRLSKMSFNSFKQIVLPKIINYDTRTKAAIEEMETVLSENKPKKKKSSSSDLLLAPNPKNAYPVFQVFQKSEKFSINDLYHASVFLSDLDYRLKSSPVDAKTQIENFIINICRKGGFVYDASEY